MLGYAPKGSDINTGSTNGRISHEVRDWNCAGPLPMTLGLISVNDTHGGHWSIALQLLPVGLMTVVRGGGRKVHSSVHAHFLRCMLSDVVVKWEMTVLCVSGCTERGMTCRWSVSVVWHGSCIIKRAMSSKWAGNSGTPQPKVFCNFLCEIYLKYAVTLKHSRYRQK